MRDRVMSMPKGLRTMLLTATTERAGVLVKTWIKYHAGEITAEALPRELYELVQLGDKRAEARRSGWRAQG